MNKLKVLELFSGIAGFSLGLDRAGGFETIGFCEIEEFCHKVLNKNFPDVPILKDIRLITKEHLDELGNIDVICGGFPCQPYSVAGKQKGKEDNRDLWPEMFRIIKEAKPTWVIGENVANFLGMEFTRTKTDLESIGYRLQPFIIPACAVGAQHRRNRVWIIAHLDRGNLRNEPRGSCRESGKGERITGYDGEEKLTSDTNSDGLGREADASKKKNDKRIRKNNWWSETTSDFGNWWSDKPRVGRAVYGFSTRLDRYRKHRVKALGNSVVPGIVEIIGKAIMKFENEKCHIGGIEG